MKVIHCWYLPDLSAPMWVVVYFLLLLEKTGDLIYVSAFNERQMLALIKGRVYDFIAVYFSFLQGTACPAPKIQKSDLLTGCSDGQTTLRTMRWEHFVQLNAKCQLWTTEVIRLGFLGTYLPSPPFQIAHSVRKCICLLFYLVSFLELLLVFVWP